MAAAATLAKDAVSLAFPVAMMPLLSWSRSALLVCACGVGALAPVAPAAALPAVWTVGQPETVPPVPQSAPVVPAAEAAPATADPQTGETADPGTGIAVPDQDRTGMDASPRGILFRVVAPVAEEATVAVGADVPHSLSAPAPSYLFGTIHFGSDEELGVSQESLAASLSPATTLVNETDPMPLPGTLLDRYRWLPPEQPLSTLISADGFTMARSLLPEVPAPVLERMKPWMVLALLEARGERTGEHTLDLRLQRLAEARGLRVVHLETPEDQLRALDCVPVEAQALVLDERLKAPWIVREMSERALGHYRERNLGAWLADLDRMVGLGEQGKAIETRARRCLIEERNARWLPALLPLLDGGGCYLAVGALHLVGEHGLLAALVRAGYRVEAQEL
ncbi:TraB/GumN family protein [Luteimonas sp. SJ-92]|uniref:TraB/GumN family protein n=1 Tax=Luteimonas salinisoli TaxID=2752307 RepID=A0A853JIS8_9GAMM|nr:TraB/GumN family protein [Luteimonas salinisoli]NZA28602.1 TraB/GumN family protein [Luteimonas salinisoli]